MRRGSRRDTLGRLPALPGPCRLVSHLQGGHWLEVGVFGDRDKVRAPPFDAVELELAEWWGETETE